MTGGYMVPVPNAHPDLRLAGETGAHVVNFLQNKRNEDAAYDMCTPRLGTRRHATAPAPTARVSPT